MRSSVAILLLGTAALLAGCQPAVERVTILAMGQSLTVEVARTEAQREHGLMGRKDLGPRDGMIFVFERDDHLAFWMKDTPTPLSIAFLSAGGKVLQIDDMQPFSTAIIQSRISARYALEMRQGSFATLGIREGDLFSFPSGWP